MLSGDWSEPHRKFIELQKLKIQDFQMLQYSFDNTVSQQI